MGNLGAYQWITTVAKKVGGPIKLLVYVALLGFLVIRLFEACCRKIYRTIKRRFKNEEVVLSDTEYVVIKESRSKEGVFFKEGDRFIVLEKDGDSVLINKFNDDNSPFFVSAEFLSEVSKYNG